MKMPSGSQPYSTDVNAKVFTLQGHTATLPRLVKVVRKPINAAGNFSTELRLIWGVAQSDGTVRNRLITLDVRNVPNQATGDITGPVTALEAIMSSSNFDDDVGVTQQLPMDSDVLA